MPELVTAHVTYTDDRRRSYDGDFPLALESYAPETGLSRGGENYDKRQAEALEATLFEVWRSTD